MQLVSFESESFDDPVRPSWQIPLLVLAMFAVTTTLAFWLSDLDIRCAALFYVSDPTRDPWPYGLNPLSRFFYYGAPLFIALFALGTVFTILAGWRRPHWRRSAVYILLTLAIGPGLIVNLVFKDYWGRPRPRQIEPFGGSLSYLPPLAMGESTHNKSFPAGHASVGFSLCVFWFLWRRRRPRLAWVALGASLVLGMSMGFGRMIAGAHFLSDVLWAGFITFFVALMLYYFVLRIPHHEAHIATASPPYDAGRQSGLWAVVYIGVAMAVLGGALLGFPVDEEIDYRLDDLPLPSTLRLDLREGDLTLYLGTNKALPLHVTGRVRGFGLPTYKIDSYGQLQGQPAEFVYYFKQRGFFTELDTQLRVDLDTAHVSRLRVHLREGDIRLVVLDDTRLPQLELQTDHGRVLPYER